MKAIIHIGIEKTGTTTIQQFLHQNREKLSEYGVAYLRTPGLMNGRKLATYCMRYEYIDDGVRDLGIVSSSDRDKWRATFEKDFVEELQNLAKNIHTVIISSEHFHSRLYTIGEVGTLFNVVDPFFTEIQILVYLRRQDRVAVSLYSTFCKSGGVGTTVLDETITADNPYYNYYDLLERWATVFGKENIVVRMFDKDKFVNNDLVQDFMYTSGISSAKEFIIPYSRNKSMSVQTQKMLVLFNATFPHFVDGEPSWRNDEMRTHILDGFGEKQEGSGAEVTKEEALAFYERFSESNQCVANAYLSANTLFADDFSMYADTVEPVFLTEDIIGDVFTSLGKFLDRYVLIPRDQLYSTHLATDPEAAIKDIASVYERDAPEVSMFLANEAEKYQPKGFLIFNMDRLNRLVQRVYRYIVPSKVKK